MNTRFLLNVWRTPGVLRRCRSSVGVTLVPLRLDCQSSRPPLSVRASRARADISFSTDCRFSEAPAARQCSTGEHHAGRKPESWGVSGGRPRG
ncbi:hypothetical protein SRHO_G00058730 [Serrasalmus rhombeus]